MAATSHFFQKSVVSDEASVKGKGPRVKSLGVLELLLVFAILYYRFPDIDLQF
jgi:hypothetical protein